MNSYKLSIFPVFFTCRSPMIRSWACRLPRSQPRRIGLWIFPRRATFQRIESKLARRPQPSRQNRTFLLGVDTEPFDACHPKSRRSMIGGIFAEEFS